MLPSRGLSRLRPAVGQTSHSICQSSRPGARQFGTAFPPARVASRSSALQNALSTRRLGASLVASSFVATQQPRLPSQHRYASTQPAVSSPAAAAAPPTPGPAAPEVVPDVSTTPLDFSSLDVLNMPEQIGYLKAMGLDYGWGPTAMMEFLLEHTYIYTGLPWWASIVAVGVITRAALFWPTVKSNETSIKMQELRKNPKYEALRKSSMDFQNPDTTKVLAARQQLNAFHKAAGIQMWRTFIPMLQMPIFFGFFRLFRGMADLPVPSLENGGILWFTDLADKDPYYILPVVSAATMFFVMRSSLVYMPADTAKMMKLISYIMTPLTIAFTFKLSAGLQLYLFVSGMLQGLQSVLLLKPWFRKMVGLPPLARTSLATPLSADATTWHAPRTMGTTVTTVTPESSGTSVFQNARKTAQEARASLSEKLRDYTTKSDTKAEIAKAKKYEERRALEEKERYYARMEEQRLKALEKQKRK